MAAAEVASPAAGASSVVAVALTLVVATGAATVAVAGVALPRIRRIVRACERDDDDVV